MSFKSIVIAFSTVLSLIILGTFITKVPAGNVGVKIYLLGGSKGIDHEVLGVGRYFIGINEELYLFPTFQQNKVYTKDVTEDSPADESFAFQTSEGMNCNMDIGITYSVDPTKVSVLFQKYRKGIHEITTIFLRNHIRDALNTVSSSMSVEAIYGAGKAKMLEDVQNKVSQAVGPTGINIEKIYLIGSVRLPQNVTAALNSKIEATQRAQQRENELREAEAAAKKEVAQAEGEAKSTLVKAEAEAKANTLKRQTLTKELIEYEMIQKWDGKMPSVVTGGSGGGLILNLGK